MMEKGRFHSFVVTYKQSDLWIGVNPLECTDNLKTFALEELIKLRSKIENFICLHPVFQKSLSPIEIPDRSPDEIKKMIESGNRAGIGPMSSVAGFFAEYLGHLIEEKFHPDEIIIENGGDIYLNVSNNITVSVYAGNSPLSEKVGIKIPAHATPLGICTSSGKIGPSLSSGNADAVVIISGDTALADALATAFGNKVKIPEDIEPALQETEKFTEILSAIMICEDKIGIRGKFEIVALQDINSAGQFDMLAG